MCWSNTITPLFIRSGNYLHSIGAMEGCTKMPIKRSIDRAIEKIRLALKNF